MPNTGVENVKSYCPKCGKEVTTIIKMFDTKICVECNRILASDKSWKQS